jgi:hypothetical protein
MEKYVQLVLDQTND